MRTRLNKILFYSIILLLILIACSNTETQDKLSILELRFMEQYSALGLTEMILEGTNRTYYISDKTEIANDDVLDACVRKKRKWPVIELTLTPVGQDKFTQLTTNNLGRCLGVLVDNKLIARLDVRAPIYDGKVIIDGYFSKQKAKQIVKGIENSKRN